MTVRSTHDMACPSCGQDDAIFIDATIRIRLLDSGAIDPLDRLLGGEDIDHDHLVEWTDTSPALCGHCGFHKEAQDFRLDREECE